MFQTLTPLQETRAYREIFAEGEIEGKIEGKAESLKRLLDRRFGTLPGWAEERLAKADSDQLDQWLDGVLDAGSLEQLFTC